MQKAYHFKNVHFSTNSPIELHDLTTNQSAPIHHRMAQRHPRHQIYLAFAPAIVQQLPCDRFMQTSFKLHKWPWFDLLLHLLWFSLSPSSEFLKGAPCIMNRFLQQTPTHSTSQHIQSNHKARPSNNPIMHLSPAKARFGCWPCGQDAPSRCRRNPRAARHCGCRVGFQLT